MTTRYLPTNTLTVAAEASMFPALSADVNAALVESVARDGVLQPLIVRAGTSEVIDGRHRLAAALAAGHALVPVIDAEGDAVTTAISANMDRRVMTPSQRAALAVSLMGAAQNRLAYASRFHVSPAIVSAAMRLQERAGAAALAPVIAGRTSIWAALRSIGADYSRTARVAPVAVVALPTPTPSPVTAVAVESAPVPAGLTAEVAAILAAFAAGRPAADAVAGVAVTVEQLDAVATYLFAAADIVSQRA